MEFQDLGAHCSVGSCNLRDFLPFHCDCCKQTYCLEHRTYASHNCPHQGQKQQIAIKCPLCALTLTLTAAQDPNLIWQLHSSSSECNPAQKTKRERCGVKGCKEVMGPSNTHVCGACKKKVCLRHRYKDHHACTGAAKQGRGGGRGVASWFGGVGGGKGGGSSTTSKGKPIANVRAPAAAGGRGRGRASVANGSGSSSSSSTSSNGQHVRGGSRGSNRQPPDTSNTLQGSVDRRRRGGGGGVAGAGGAYPGQAGHKNSSNGVVDLTNDDESSSSSTLPSLRPSQAGQTAGGGCPFCRALFVDPVLLVEHVERVHGEEGRMGGGGEGGGMGCQVG